MLHAIGAVTFSKVFSISSSLSTASQRDSWNVPLDVDLGASGSNSRSTLVHTNSNVPNQTLGEGFSQKLSRDDRRGAISIGNTVDGVFVVQGSVESGQMGVVRGQLVDGVDQFLWEEQLTHMLNRGIGVARVVCAHIGLHCHVDVSGSAVVVAGEDGEEFRDSSIVGLGDTA